jgi:hypothetical protein
MLAAFRGASIEAFTSLRNTLEVCALGTNDLLWCCTDEIVAFWNLARGSYGMNDTNPVTAKPQRIQRFLDRAWRNEIEQPRIPRECEKHSLSVGAESFARCCTPEGRRTETLPMSWLIFEFFRRCALWNSPAPGFGAV